MAEYDMQSASLYVDESTISKELEKLNELSEALNKADEKAQQLKLDNAKELFNYTVNLINKETNARIEADNEANKSIERARVEAYKKELNKAKKLAKKAHKELSEDDIKAIEAKYKRENYEAAKEKIKKQAEHKKELEALHKEREDSKKFIAEQNELLWGKGHTVNERLQAFKDLTTSIKMSKDGTAQAGFSLGRALTALSNSMADFAKKLDNSVNKIAANKGIIDTRLSGSKNTRDAISHSYWDNISQQLIGIAGASPFIKQEDLVSNLNSLVGRGISFNITQRAFLNTIKDRIATTFNIADGTLLRLVRIQQEDSSAARLGMEAALNSFLNNMYETTEYMSDIMSSIKGSLEEAMSLMTAEEAVGFEYQVQKWMGSMYSVGMSQGAVQGMAGALGKLAAGDINSLTGSGFGNLMIMAANEANLSLSKILADGLNDSEIDSLLSSAVSFLSGLYEESKGSRVIQQQMASVYGVTASDLKAAANISTSDINAVSSSTSNYNQSLKTLANMAGSVGARTSFGEMASNMLANFQYTMAAGMANDPITYSIVTLAKILEDTTGGLPLPFISALGTGVDLNTSVSEIMRSTALSASILKGIGLMSTSGGGGISLTSTLNSLGLLSGGDVVARGNNASLSEAGMLHFDQKSTQTNMQGNANANDILESTYANANDTKNSLAAEDQTEKVEIKDVDDKLKNIYDLLADAVSGIKPITVTPILQTAGADMGWPR